MFTVAAAWIFRPYFHADETQIDPRLRGLKKPYRNVKLDVFFDVGSSGVGIPDAVGRSKYFFIPCDEPHPKVYVWAKPSTRKGEVPASNHAATQQELVAIASEYCDDIWG